MATLPHTCVLSLKILGPSTCWSSRKLSSPVYGYLSLGAGWKFQGSSPVGVEFSVNVRPDRSAICTMGIGSFLEVKEPEPDVDHEWLTDVSLPLLCTCEVMLWDGLHLLTFRKFWSIPTEPTAADSNQASVPSLRLLPNNRLPFTALSD